MSGWMCAKEVSMEESDVVPGYSYVKLDVLHPVVESRTVPPDWCERPLEQVILNPDDKPDLREDARLVYDGNSQAENRAEELKSKRWRGGW